jgi:membrane protein DedA with SNARE-associated domain
MPTTLTEIIGVIADLPTMTLYGLSLLAGFIEYILPFLPGDTAVVALGAIAPHSQHSGWLIWALTTAASTLGGLLSFGFGVWLRNKERLQGFKERHHDSIQIVVERFERRGPAYLAVNRFIPGLRTFFFIAAAFAKLRFHQVLIWGFVSSAIWMGLLVGVAVALSANIEQLEATMGTLNTILLGFAIGLIGWLILKIIRASRTDDASDEQ